MSDTPTLRYVVSLRDGTRLGEIVGGRERTLDRVLNGRSVASVAVDLFDPAQRDLAMELAFSDDEHLLEVWRTPSDGGAPHLVFRGDVVDDEVSVSAEEGAVTINAISPHHRLAHRVWGKADPATPTRHVDTKRGDIVATMLTVINGENPTGISLGHVADTSTVTVEYSFRPVEEIIGELSGGQIGALVADGFDWQIVPLSGGTTIGRLEVGSAAGDAIHPRLIGRDRPTAVFELGPRTRDNVLTLTQARSRQAMANVVYEPGIREGLPVVQTLNSVAIGARGRHEAVISAQVDDQSLRQDLVALHLSARKQARRILEFTPAPEPAPGRAGDIAVPRLWEDYDVGDRIYLRASINGTVPVDVGMRLYGVSTALGEDGQATHTLRLVAE